MVFFTQDVSIMEMKGRLSAIVDRLNQLILRVTEKTELGVFLIDVCQDFELDMKANWEKVTVITIDDKLDALKWGRMRSQRKFFL